MNRYCRNVCSRPLWPMSSGQPSTADIPNCSYCGKPRCFEFQVVLLHPFLLKDIDVSKILSQRAVAETPPCHFTMICIYFRALICVPSRTGWPFWSLPSIFQVLPQLLYYFGVKNDADSLDWATIVVYSCEASCDAAMGYKEEFAWVQVSSPSQVVPWKSLYVIQLLWLKGFYNSPLPPPSFW